MGGEAGDAGAAGSERLQAADIRVLDRGVRGVWGVRAFGLRQAAGEANAGTDARQENTKSRRAFASRRGSGNSSGWGGGARRGPPTLGGRGGLAFRRPHLGARVLLNAPQNEKHADDRSETDERCEASGNADVCVVRSHDGRAAVVEWA
ncbi:MAG: hypothetical protein COA68_17670 [Oceanobacter sp.]|nr:MAG: hypothetical protein COA68_17670 [Oceanobacter sp.]